MSSLGRGLNQNLNPAGLRVSNESNNQIQILLLDFSGSDEIQNWKKPPKRAVLMGFMQFGYKNHNSKIVMCQQYWTLTPMLSIKDSGSEITAFCSVQGWLSQAVQWNTTHSHLQLSKLSKENVTSRKTFLFLSIPASDLTCVRYAESARLKFSDAICDLVHVLEVLTGCTESNMSCKFSAPLRRSPKFLKFGVKNNRAPKTRTQWGLPFNGYKYLWLSKRSRGIAQRSVHRHGIWKTCAQLTDWLQSSNLTTAPSWYDHSTIQHHAHVVRRNTLKAGRFSCCSVGAVLFVHGMKKWHKTYIWLGRKLRVTLKITELFWGNMKCLTNALYSSKLLKRPFLHCNNIKM